MDKIKSAIIGLGRIASLLEDDERREKPCTHAGALSSNPDCIMAAGLDIDNDKRRLFAQRWKVPVYDNAERMLKEQKPEILVIATAPNLHAQYCRLGAASGAPVVICEKPLADTVQDARGIASLTSGKNFKILVNHERRYSDDYLKAKAVLDGGRLGKLLSVKAVICFGRARRLVNMLWDDATHLIDSIMFLTGADIEYKTAWGADLSGKEGTAWLLSMLIRPARTGPAKRGEEIPCIIEAGAGRDHLIFEIEFSFEMGRLRVGNGVWELWESAPSPYAEKFRSLEKTSETFEGKTGFFANMVKDAVECVRDPKHYPRSSARDALAVIEYLTVVN
jgi:predicted dehydrogenase